MTILHMNCSFINEVVGVYLFCVKRHSQRELAAWGAVVSLHVDPLTRWEKLPVLLLGARRSLLELPWNVYGFRDILPSK